MFECRANFPWQRAHRAIVFAADDEVKWQEHAMVRGCRVGEREREGGVEGKMRDEWVYLCAWPFARAPDGSLIKWFYSRRG